MSKKGKNKGQENLSRHQRDLIALRDARLQQVLGDESFVSPSNEIVVCTVEDFALPPRMLFDPLEQLQRDVAEDRPTAPEIKERLIHSSDYTVGDVISAIKEGNSSRRGKEQHI